MDIRGAIDAVTKPFRKPEGYVSAKEEAAAAAKAAAPAPAPAPAPTQLGGMNLGAIKRREEAAGMKHGGKVKGPGTGTSDSVPINASAGEYIMPADSTRKIGVRKLDAMRHATHSFGDAKPAADGKPGMANGGKVCPPAMGAKRRKGYADGGLVTEEDKRRNAVAQIPGQSFVAPPSNGTMPGEFAREVNNGLNALGGMGVVASVPLRAAQAAEAAAPTIFRAAPVLTNGLPRLGAPAARQTADFVAGVGSAAQAAPGAVPRIAANVAPVVNSIPQTIPGLVEGARANAAAAGVRTISNASAGLTAADAQQGAEPVPAAAAGARGPGGAVFGMYPAAAGTRLSSYATDNRLRTGQLADGSVPVQISGVQALPQGVDPSTAGAGRGSVNPPPAIAATAPAAVAQPTAPATATSGAAPQVPGTAGANAAPQPGTVPVGGDPSLGADRLGVMNRATQTYREIAAANNGAANLPAGAGTVIPVDHQAERNAKFDEEQMRYNAARVGGRGGEALLHSADAMMAARLGATNADAQRVAAAANLDTQQAGETKRTQIRTDAETAQADRRQNTADAEAGVRIGVGKQALSEAQRQSKLKAQLEVTTDPAERKRLQEQLLVEQGKEPHANRYTVVPGGQTVDPTTGQVVRQASEVIDNSTGQLVQTGAQAAPKAAPPAQAVAMLKSNPALAAQFDQKYGAGAAARLLATK